MIIIINCIKFNFCYTVQRKLHYLSIIFATWGNLNDQAYCSIYSLSILSVIASVTFAADQKTSSVSNPVKLETIVVTAAGYEQDVSKAPASMTVITREELEARQYNDITDVLRNTPGVVISGAGSAQTVSIRGMGSSYTLFFWSMVNVNILKMSIRMGMTADLKKYLAAGCIH